MFTAVHRQQWQAFSFSNGMKCTVFIFKLIFRCFVFIVLLLNSRSFIALYLEILRFNILYIKAIVYIQFLL